MSRACTLDGYTIELRYGNGKTERVYFYFYPDKNKEKKADVIGIGGSGFILQK